MTINSFIANVKSDYVLAVSCEQIAKIVLLLMDEVMKWLRQSIKDSLIRIMMASGAAKIDNYVSVSGSNENVGTAFSHTNGLCVYVYCMVSSSMRRGRTDNDNAFIVHCVVGLLSDH